MYNYAPADLFAASSLIDLTRQLSGSTICDYTMPRTPPSQIRLTALERERIEKAQIALTQQASGAPTTFSRTIHVLLAKGYEVLDEELKIEEHR